MSNIKIVLLCIKSHDYVNEHKLKFDRGKLYNAHIITENILIKITDDFGKTASYHMPTAYEYFVNAIEHRNHQLSKIIE